MMNAPQEDLAIPENLKRAIEKSKNIVTVNEAEAQRLKDLVTSLEYTVGQLHNKEVQLNEDINKLQNKVNTLQVEQDDLYITIDSLSIDIKSKEESLKSIIIESTSIQDGLDIRKDEIDKAEIKIVDEINKLNTREKVASEREVAVLNKEEKLRNYFN